MDISARKPLIPYAGSYRKHRHSDDGDLTPKQEVLLSYLMGLAPVGEPVEIDRDTLMSDLEIVNRFSYYQHLHALLVSGFIRRVQRGRQGITGIFVVVRRLEDVQPREGWRLQKLLASIASERPRRRREWA